VSAGPIGIGRPMLLARYPHLQALLRGPRMCISHPGPRDIIAQQTARTVKNVLKGSGPRLRSLHRLGRRRSTAQFSVTSHEPEWIRAVRSCVRCAQAEA